MSRLTKTQKEKIIEKYKTGNYNYTALAKEYSVDPSTISRLFKNWIYDDAKVYLKRKYDKFQEVKILYPQKDT